MPITGTNLNDFLNGTVFNDSISGLGGNDTLSGGAGNDTLDGGSGNDQIFGDLNTPYFTYNGKAYLLSSAGTWTQTQAQAVSLGGNLVTVNDAAENQWLVNTFGGTETLWIGFNDAVVEGTFRWANGEAVTYTNWAPGEPNNFGGNEDYAQINWGSPGKWNDGTSTQVLRGIIEIDTRSSSFNDTIIGGAGNDTLDGGFGSDTLSGGVGADKFVFTRLFGGSIDTITDFNWTQNDKIQISRSGFGATSLDQFNFNAENGALSFLGTQFATVQNQVLGFAVSLDVELVA